MAPGSSISAAAALPGAAASRPAHGDLVVLAPCSRFTLSQGEGLLVREPTGARLEVSSRALNVLARCSTLRTPEAHAAAVATALSHLIVGEAEVLGLLRKARTAGLCIGSRELASALGTAPAPVAEPVATVVAVVTCDRPGLLERALESVSAGLSDTGISGCFVIDDSRNPAHEQRNRALTRDAAARHGGIRYFGRAEQQALVRGLCRALPGRRSAIEFLLGRWPDADLVSHGRAFNFTLLLSFGGILVHLDDDVVCRACPPPLPVSNTLRWDPLVRDVAFFPDDAGREACCAGAGMHPISSLSGAVGRGMAAISSELQRSQGLEARFDGMTADDAEALLGGRPRVVGATCGLYGDPGTASANWLFQLSGDSCRRFTADQGRYRAALRLRNVWLGSAGHRFTRGHGLLSPLRALDHRTPLPPYFPLFRGSDYLLGRLLPLADRDAWFLELPWAVPHLPEPRRQWPADLLDRPELLSFARFTGMFWGQRLLPPLSADAGHRLELLGGQIGDMGEADLGVIREAMSGCLRYLRSDLLRQLDRQLQEEAETPRWYRRDLEHLIEVNRRAMEGAAEPCISDLPGCGRGDFPVSLVRELWRNYGEALRAWPQILAVARGLQTDR